MKLWSPQRLDEAWHRAQVLVDDKLGVLSGVNPSPNPPGLPTLFRYRATRRPLRNEGGQVLVPVLSPGVGFKRDMRQARMAAIGEAVERYCCTITAHQTILKTNYSELPGPGVDPLTITRFTAEQYSAPRFPFKPVHRDTEMLWVEGATLPGGEPYWVPADLVFMPSPQRWSIREGVSNGLACGSSLWHAIYAALCEAVERDAFASTWLLTLSAPRIDPASIPDPQCQDLLAEYARYGIRITINDLTADNGVPAFLVTGERDEGWPRVWLAAHAGLNPLVALQAALEECFGTLAFLLAADRRVDAPEQIAHMHDHAFYYATGKAMDQLKFLLTAPVQRYSPSAWETAEAASYQEAALAVVERVRRHGCEVVVVDLTTPDVEVAGLHVVRVVVPQFQIVHHFHPCLECPRMWGIHRARGMFSGSVPNLAVHPFP